MSLWNEFKISTFNITNSSSSSAFHPWSGYRPLTRAFQLSLSCATLLSSPPSHPKLPLVPLYWSLPCFSGSFPVSFSLGAPLHGFSGDARLWFPKGVANPAPSPLLDFFSDRALVGPLPDDVIPNSILPSNFQDLPKSAVNKGLDPSHRCICCPPGFTPI